MHCNPDFLQVGDSVIWVGALAVDLAGRFGHVVGIVPDSSGDPKLIAYRILRDDGIEVVYYGSQLQPAASAGTFSSQRIA